MMPVTSYDYIHNKRELELMLAGKKPLAVFAQHEGVDVQLAVHDQPFDEHVAAGRLCRFEHERLTADKTHVKYIAFTQPDEAWRAPAYFQLMDFLHNHAWSSHLEWLEGSLLGYTDEENRYHHSQKYPEVSEEG